MAIRMVALLDGTLIDPATPLVRADDTGVSRGDGVFDAMLAVNGVARDREEHLERLATSARMLELPAPDLDGFGRAIDAILGAWDWGADPEAIIRILHTRGGEGTGEPNGWAMAAPVPANMRDQRENGSRILLLNRGYEGPEIAQLPWLLPGAKYLSYAINMAAYRHAAANDADDVLFISPSGALLEGPTSSVVLDIDGELVTPTFDGVLASITVKDLLRRAPDAGLTVRQEPLTVADIGRARGAWLLSSGRLYTQVTHIDGKEIPASPLHEKIVALFSN